MRTIVVLLLVSLSVSAQTFTVTDDSPSDSPITLRGTVRIDPTNLSNNTCALIGHNSSPKTAVAWRFDVEIASPSGTIPGYLRHDFFFEDQDTLLAVSAKPNSDYDPNPLDIDCTMLTGGFHSKVLWVQFIDGSTWGDATAESYMMTQRTNALDFLNALKSAYSSGGETAFEQVLNSYAHRGPSMLGTFLRDEAFSTRFRLTKLKGVPAELAEVNRMLSVASTRANWLK